MEPRWKKCHFTDLYEISDHGHVRRVDTGHILRPKIDRYGYPTLGLSIRGKRIHTTIHRLVAHAWVPGWRKGLQVNHKDGDKTNAHRTNLEWTTGSKNIIHSYTTGLNGNTAKVILRDITTGEEKEFRSVKSLAKSLGMYSSLLAPLIKHSAINPVLGRYHIELDDETSIDTANTKNFGIPAFVFDEITQSVTEYPSVLIASYHTGLRCLGGIRDDGCLYRVGYHVSKRKEHLPTNTECDFGEVLNERYAYLTTPYSPRDYTYTLFDYYTKKEFDFNDLEGVADFINNVHGELKTTVRTVSGALSGGSKLGRTGLIRGYGIRSSKHNFDWYPYWEEVIITNRLSTFAVPVYKITKSDSVIIAVGKKELFSALGYIPNKNINSIRFETVVKTITDPNITVCRLNRPISQDEDIVSSAWKHVAARNGAGGV